MSEPRRNAYAQLGDIAWMQTQVERVFAHIPEADRRRFFPQNDYRILPHRDRIVVRRPGTARSS